MACDGIQCPLAHAHRGQTMISPQRGSGLDLVILDAPVSAGYRGVLEKLFRKAGMEPTVAYIDPFPRGSSERWANDVIQHALQEHLLPLLQSKPWQRIFIMGEQPLRLLTGKNSIYQQRGCPQIIPWLDPKRYTAIATFSPEDLQKQQKFYPVVVNDLMKRIGVWNEHYNLYPSLADVRNFKEKIFAFDIETSYEADANGVREIYMVALSAEAGTALVVPFAGDYISELRRIFANADEVIGHNCIQFDIPQLAAKGIALRLDVMIWDTMLMQHLRFPELPHDLEFVASQFLCKPAWKAEKEVFQLYAARDVDATYQVWEAILQEMEHAGLMPLYQNVQVPLAKICRLMTETGIKLDPSRLEKVQSDLKTEIAALEQKLPPELRTYQITKRKRVPAPEGTLSPKTGKPIKFLHEEVYENVAPWRKDAVKKALLYDQWGLPPQLHPKTQKITVDKIALDKLYRRLSSPSSEYYNPERADIVKALKDISKKDHMISSFVKEERKGTERIHPEFNVHGTSSGRLSSSGGEAGNYQNQPELARALYVPTFEDWEIAEVDYSNIENRLTALLANDTERLKRYDDPKHSDYKLLASRAFGIPYDQVEKDNDREAPYGKSKAIVLGTNYGLGSIKLANMYDMDLQEVKRIMFQWKQEIKQTVAWQREVGELARKKGYLVTPFGRKRWFYTSDYFTKALSFLPQSTAADIIYRAMIGLMYERIGWPKEKALLVTPYVEPLPQPARLLLQVHDALVIEYPKAMRERVLGTVKRVMEQPWSELKGYAVPVGIACGPSWGETKAVKIG